MATTRTIQRHRRASVRVPVRLSTLDAVRDGMAGRFAIGVDGSGALPGAVSVRDGRADIAGRLAFDGSRWRVWSESCQPAIAG